MYSQSLTYLEGGAEPAESKKRTKVAENDVIKSTAPVKGKTTEATSRVTRSNSTPKPAAEPKVEKKSKVTKSKITKPAVSDDFAGFSESEEEDTAPAADVTDALLAGFSSDEDEDAEQPAALTKIPSLPDAADLQAQLAAAAVNPESVPGTIYVGRIPRGFYEPQMRAYFTQFGTINRLRLSRNKLTGKPKHYAYIEFESSAVAEIVAKTMDKYLMFGHILQVRLLKPEEVHPDLWKGANKRFKAMPRNKIEGAELNKPRGREVWEKRVKNEEARRKAKASKLKEMGYEFDMPKVRQVDSVPKQGIATLEIEAPVEEEVDEAAEPAEIVAEEIAEVMESADAAGEKRKKGRKEKKGTKKARLST